MQAEQRARRLAEQLARAREERTSLASRQVEQAVLDQLMADEASTLTGADQCAGSGGVRGTGAG